MTNTKTCTIPIDFSNDCNKSDTRNIITNKMANCKCGFTVVGKKGLKLKLVHC